jgi:hypothetical protein
MQGGTNTPPRNENVIAAEELRNSTYVTLFDLIQSRRPRWLDRNYSAVLRADRVSTLAVFMDNQVFGGPDALRQLPVTAAAEVRYYGPSEAEARFGPGYLNGVIQVLSRASQ